MIAYTLVSILLISLFSCNITFIPQEDVLINEDTNLGVIDLTKVYECYVNTSFYGDANLSVKFRVPEDTIYKYYLVSDEDFGRAYLYQYDDNNYEKSTIVEEDKNRNVYLLRDKYYVLYLFQGNMYGDLIEVKMWRP